MSADVAIVGAGYVGMPLARVFGEAGKDVVLVDGNREVGDGINRGESHIGDVASDPLKTLVDAGRVSATTDYDALRGVDAILIALPTPLSSHREPDLTIVESAADEIASRLRKGQVVVLESTTYPGTTRESLQPILERSGMKAGGDFHLAFSPERVDPGRTDWTTKNTPKLVGGLTPACTERAVELYRSAVDTVVPLSSPETAEMTKLLENIFRAVNIALVNELAQLCERMEVDVWEVVEAAETKPFGFMSFKPGPGLGGHCIPIDPFYLTWKAREYDFYTEFIDLAGKVNANMPFFCRSLISQALNHGAEKSLKGSRILILGVSYKADIDDVRESPAKKIVELLHKAGADVSYHDPHVPEFDGMSSVDYAPESYDDVLADESVEAVVVATPVPTHYELARRALEAGKHVFVEKPPAMRGAEMEELCELAEEHDRVLMPGHLLLYHPGVQKLKEIVDSGELGEVLYVYGNRQNLGTFRTNENALWSLGVHDLSVLLHLVEEEPSEVEAHGNAFLNRGVEDVVFCYLRFPSGKMAHMHLSWLDPHKIRRITVVGNDRMAVFDDMDRERKITVYDNWRTRTGDIYSPKVDTTEPLRLECQHFLGLVAGEGDPHKAARDAIPAVRALEQLQASLETVAA